MRLENKIVLFFLALMTGLSTLHAQSVNDFEQIELNRRAQLTQRKDSASSLAVNALHIEPRFSKKLDIALSPITVRQQYQSHHPFSLNDGAMIPAGGYQSYVQAGLSIGYRHWSLNLNPEFVVAENKDFQGFFEEHADLTWASYYRYLNVIDIPERFGSKNYSKVFAGQSSLNYAFKKYSVGVSTENMWWGPGYRSTLVMTNNAPGFLHLEFSTTAPVKTKIGSFEGQIVGGQLTNSNYDPPETWRSNRGQLLFVPKRNDKRYLAGLVVTWQPKWLPNFWIGLAKASYAYSNDLRSPLDYLPLQGFFGGLTNTKLDKEEKKPSLGSMFFRYVLPKDKTEIYFEFGRNDRAVFPWNIMTTQPYRRSYVGGMRKLFSLRSKDQYLQFAAEITELGLPTGDLIRDGGSMYTHTNVRQGYTNNGQIIGAGIGPGSNMQTIEISWVKGKKKIGLEFERLQHNNDFYYSAFAYIQDFRRFWTDISTTAKCTWDYKNIFINAQLGIRRSMNYQWFVLDAINTQGSYFKSGYDVLNVEAKLSVSYRFSRR